MQFFQELASELTKKIQVIASKGTITDAELLDVKETLNKLKYGVMNSVYSSEEAIEYTLTSYEKIISDLSKFPKPEVSKPEPTVEETPKEEAPVSKPEEKPKKKAKVKDKE